MTTYHARDLAARLASLEAERTSRVERNVPVPEWVNEAIVMLQGQLANEYNREEHDNQAETEAMATLDPTGWWHPYLLASAFVLACAAAVKWWPV